MCPYRGHAGVRGAKRGQRDRGERRESTKECFGYEVVVGREIMPFIGFGTIVDEDCCPKYQLATMQDKAK